MEINGFNNYLIYPDGKVFSKKSNKYLKGSLDTDGYYQVNLYNGSRTNYKTYKRHKLVALHYISNPENKTQIDHIDRNKLNNNIENLRWVTPTENQQNRGMFKNNTSGMKYICYKADKEGWTFKREINKVKFEKFSKNKNIILWTKLIYSLKNNH